MIDPTQENDTSRLAALLAAEQRAVAMLDAIESASSATTRRSARSRKTTWSSSIWARCSSSGKPMSAAPIVQSNVAAEKRYLVIARGTAAQPDAVVQVETEVR